MNVDVVKLKLDDTMVLAFGDRVSSVQIDAVAQELNDKLRLVNWAPFAGAPLLNGASWPESNHLRRDIQSNENHVPVWDHQIHRLLRLPNGGWKFYLHLKIPVIRQVNIPALKLPSDF